MDDEKIKNIESIFREVAAVHTLRFGYNTHYEAYNYELDWWEGGNHHRLDFQPMGIDAGVTACTGTVEVQYEEYAPEEPKGIEPD